MKGGAGFGRGRLEVFEPLFEVLRSWVVERGWVLAGRVPGEGLELGSRPGVPMLFVILLSLLLRSLLVTWRLFFKEALFVEFFGVEDS